MLLPKSVSIKIHFPVFHASMDANEKEIIQIFMQSQRDVPHVRAEAKILSAIYKTADLVGTSDAYIAKILVDYGLRAPRLAFPVNFLDHIDNTMIRSEQAGFSLLSKSYKKLINYWTAIGEQPLEFARNPVPAYTVSSYITA